jgi:hypothetical protein
MRRMLAILLMLIVPFQFAWSTVESMHGHLDHEGSASVFHYHDDDHHHDTDIDHHDDIADGLAEQGLNDDGHHDGHFHPVLNIIVFEPQLNLGKALPHDPPARPPSSFTSHIPSLFDWPPSVLL